MGADLHISRMPLPDSTRSDSSSTPPGGEAPIVVRSEELLDGQREILILHAREVYRLRLTRNGKLILTK